MLVFLVFLVSIPVDLSVLAMVSLVSLASPVFIPVSYAGIHTCTMLHGETVLNCMWYTHTGAPGVILYIMHAGTVSG